VAAIIQPHQLLKAIRDVLISAVAFHQLMTDSPVFRSFVMKNYGALIGDLIVLLDEVAFSSLNARLAKILIAGSSSQITRTHQQIADELGTAREVVSRQLKILEHKGLISMGRGHVDVINKIALENLVTN
jgi:CRP/FNR family transcriptional regulator, anaerobic regulatory protein